MRSRRFLLLLVLVGSACGGASGSSLSGPSAPAVSSTSAARPAPSLSSSAVAPSLPPVAGPEEASGVDVPTFCAEAGKQPCLPDPGFARRMCDTYQPGIALAMFGKGTPWARYYVRGRSIVAWKATGAATEKVKLEFDEEVIVLRHHGAAPGGMVVSGAGDSYDVIRWDGTCVSLDQGEMTRYLPPVPRNPELPWKQYDTQVQDALLADRAVTEAYKARRNECKGISMGRVSDACAKANHALSVAITRYVRAGGKVPIPERLP